MKICWENIEKLRLNSKGNFRGAGDNIFVYVDACVECGDSFLTARNNNSKFCCRGCAQTGERNNMFGRGYKQEKNPAFRHGLSGKNIASFDTYGSRLAQYEDVKSNNGILEVRCSYCGRWYLPKLYTVVDRVRFIETGRTFEAKFYCSLQCKVSCPIYNKKKFPATYKRITSREVQPELRKMVFERDLYMCLKCGKSITTGVELHCHHIEGIVQNPIESADIDVCITLCKNCHKEVHKIKNCRYHDLKCVGGHSEFKSF